MLEERRETLGATIDELQERLENLESQYEELPFTDERIRVIVDEIAELRKMFSALETIDETADYSAKRALIEILNLRATLRITNEER